ncbi:uncharacterized protein LOC127247764 [Andrographis paniculata]|uniref:uncharacterized protein LOC127247764 n=1 Tax=Andrographis paniculata TaxID=175694 RepID=UPI0021E9433C|nr:uncharacterized protein LOC127247764 [Andrographis paniculata]
MGNCLRKRSAAVEWGGDDWGSFGAGGGNPPPGDEAEKLSVSSTSSSLIEGKEVKIKISKKQLEQVLKTAEIEGLSAQQVLAKLIDGGGDDQFSAAHQRSWKPDLTSIPE